MPSPICQYAINLIVNLPIKRDRGVFMNISVQQYHKINNYFLCYLYWVCHCFLRHLALPSHFLSLYFLWWDSLRLHFCIYYSSTCFSKYVLFYFSLIYCNQNKTRGFHVNTEVSHVFQPKIVQILLISHVYLLVCLTHFKLIYSKDKKIE